MISGIFALCGAGLGGALRVHFGLVPILGAFMALVPFCWLYIRRGRRLKAFGAQLPDAMELVARALRAGQSLPAGFSMVSTEMGDPIGERVFEEQNLGCSMEDLVSLADRIPNTDLKFFVTAVVLQRQTAATWRKSSTRSASSSANDSNLGPDPAPPEKADCRASS